MVTYTRSRGPDFWELKTCIGEAQSHRAHSHGEWSLGLILGGACRVGCAGTETLVTAPALVWFGPETVHDCRPVDPAGWNLRMLYWPGRDGAGTVGIRALSPQEVRAWTDFFSDLEADRPGPSPEFPWGKLAQSGVPRRPGLDCSVPGSTDLARPDRPYKRLHGLAPTQHRTILRVRRAQELLRQGIPLTEAALEAGFYDQSQFTRTFRAVTGTTPGRYAGG